MSKRGKFIVIEGSDGSGKATQLDLLAKRLQKESSKKIIKFDFPQYDKFFGRLVGRYLIKEFGDANPYLASLTYALDRWSAKPKLEKYLKEGKIILSNRYYLSSMAHQTGRMPLQKRKEFLEFLEELELKQFGIPKDDLTIYLYVPVKTSQKLVDMKMARQYTNGRRRDIHEASKKHLSEASKMYELLAKKYSRIKKIDCTDKNGNLKNITEIHEMVWSEISKYLKH